MANLNVVENWVIDPDAAEDSLEAKAPYIDNGTDILNPSRYYCRDFMELEWERMWTRTWLIAGVETDIPESGDYLTYLIRHEEFIVVRQEDGSVKAFYNVCPHRGNRIIHNERGSMSQFTCSFHSWKFNLDGGLNKITDAETFRTEVICHRPNLKEVRCETFAGIVFINMDDDAPPLKDRLGLPEGYLEQYGIDKMFVVRHVISEWGANWKTGVDAFYETYHLHAVHPETQSVMADMGVQVDLYPHGASRMIVPIGQKSQRVKDQQTIDEGLAYMMRAEGMDPDTFPGDAPDVRPALGKHKRERARQFGINYDHFTDAQLTDSWATGIFPNVQIGMHPEGCFLMRFMPHPTDPERFYYDNITLFKPAADPNYKAPDWMGIPDGTDLTGGVRPDTEHVPLGVPPNLGLVLDQDSTLIPVVQKGIRSRAFRGALWSEQEQRLRHFHRELDRYINNEK